MLCNADSLRQYRSRLDKRLLGSSAGLTDKFSPKVIGLSALAIMLPSVALNTVIRSRNESSCAACLILSGEIKPGLAMKGIHDFEPGDIKIVRAATALILIPPPCGKSAIVCRPDVGVSYSAFGTASANFLS